jgi:hypothetical protein
LILRVDQTSAHLAFFGDLGGPPKGGNYTRW